MRVSLFLLILAGCGGNVTLPGDTDLDGVDTDSTGDTDLDTDTDVDPGPGPDLMETGPAAAIRDEGSLSVGACTLSYTRFRPDAAEGAALVVLAHGFARDQARMHGWATHWASWGLEVVTPDLCNLGLFNTDHPANGRQMAALARQLADGRPVILAGQSAGALAATLAAAEVEGAGLLALDPVDSDEIGERAAPDITGPVGALFGEPSQCNSEGNGERMLVAADDRRWWRIEDADHCDFENPTNRGCEILCRSGEADREAIREALLGMTTGFLRWHGGIDERGEAWWTPRDPYFDRYADQLQVP